MSVIKSKREESVVEFVNTARELNIFSIRQCTKSPKRYTLRLCNMQALYYALFGNFKGGRRK